VVWAFWYGGINHRDKDGFGGCTLQIHGYGEGFVGRIIMEREPMVS
jgi:hypothetical protein